MSLYDLSVAEANENRGGGTAGLLDEGHALVYVPDPDYLTDEQTMAQQALDDENEREAKLERVERLVQELTPHLMESADGLAASDILVKLAEEAGLATWAARRAMCVGLTGNRGARVSDEAGLDRLAADVSAA